jgi:hypothetical protein
MDPNLFRIDWEQTGEVLVCIVVLAFIVERALALIFESKIYIKVFGDWSIKEFITLLVCGLITWAWSFDALSVILHGDKPTFIGRILTAGVIAGGSKASLKLFRDVMNVENEQARVARHKRVEDDTRAMNKPRGPNEGGGTASAVAGKG